MELVHKGWDDFTQSPGSAGSGGDDVFGSCTSAPWVFVTAIKDTLVIGVSVDSVHNTIAHSKAFMQYPGNECQCVGGAGSSRNNLMFGRIIAMFVDSDH